MPNFARFLLNVLLYFFYVLIIIGLGGIIIPFVMQSLGYEIPRLSKEESDLIGYISAGIILTVTLFFRRACYISFKKEDELLHKVSYTQKKKHLREITQKKKEERETVEKNIDSGDDEDMSLQENIKIYVDKEIK